MSLPFELPPVTPDGYQPVWQGNGFRIGEHIKKVLEYSSNLQGWTDDLTLFHEETVGDDHFIDKASRDHALQQLKQHIQPEERAIILEIGCSSGFMLRRMHQCFPKALIMGADVICEPLEKLADLMPQIPLFRFDMNYCPLPNNSVDAIVVLNVLEHIENDSATLQQIYRILKPGGIVIIEVPAGPKLYDIHDQLLMHYRRYTLSGLRKLVLQQKFKVIKQSHLAFFLSPAFWIVKKRNRLFKPRCTEAQKRMLQNNIKKNASNKLMHLIMRLELFIGKFISYPVGIRCLMICKK